MRLMDSGNASNGADTICPTIQVAMSSIVRQARDPLSMNTFESQDGASDDTKFLWVQNSINAWLIALYNVMEFTPQDLLWPRSEDACNGYTGFPPRINVASLRMFHLSGLLRRCVVEISILWRPKTFREGPKCSPVSPVRSAYVSWICHSLPY